MTTSRIEPLSPAKAPLVTRLMYRFAKRRFGEVPEPFAIYAHHRGLLVAGAVQEGMLERASTTLPAGVRELAVYWTAHTVGCSWCVDFGAMLQRLDGLDTERLKHIDDYAAWPAYTDDERATIAYADAMTTDPHDVTDEQIADLLQTADWRSRLESLGLYNPRVDTDGEWAEMQPRTGVDRAQRVGLRSVGHREPGQVHGVAAGWSAHGTRHASPELKPCSVIPQRGVHPGAHVLHPDLERQLDDAGLSEALPIRPHIVDLVIYVKCGSHSTRLATTRQSPSRTRASSGQAATPSLVRCSSPGRTSCASRIE